MYSWMRSSIDGKRSRRDMGVSNRVLSEIESSAIVEIVRAATNKRVLFFITMMSFVVILGWLLMLCLLRLLAVAVCVCVSQA
jgi:hypothetical protein